MSWKWNIILLVIILLLIGALIIKRANKANEKTGTAVGSAWRYVALGDSYTIGEGVSEGERWPNQLVEKLRKEDIDIALVGNPARTGWTTQELIDIELPEVAKQNANFVTVQIGVNDFVQGQPPEIFRLNVAKILDTLAGMPGKDRVVVVTIPDFSKTPAGKRFGSEANLVAGTQAFNVILNEEASRRGVRVVDIWGLSQVATGEGMLNQDGLHPSGKQYGLWVDMIYPTVRILLGDPK